MHTYPKQGLNNAQKFYIINTKKLQCIKQTLHTHFLQHV